jgi:hypothetical protein
MMPLPHHKKLRGLLSLSRERNIHDYRLLAKLTDGLYVTAQRGDGWTQGMDSELQALLAEYTSLRQESLETIKNRIQILTLGIGAIGAQIVGALSIAEPAKNKLLVVSLFSFSIPVTGVYIILLWVSEAIRSHRIGYYLASECEARINRLFGRLVVSWEASLWTGLLPRDELGGPSMVVLVMIGLISGLSPLIGLSLVRSAMSPRLIIALISPYIVLTSAALYTKYLMPRMKNIPIIRSPSCHSKL